MNILKAILVLLVMGMSVIAHTKELVLWESKGMAKVVMQCEDSCKSATFLYMRKNPNFPNGELMEFDRIEKTTLKKFESALDKGYRAVKEIERMDANLFAVGNFFVTYSPVVFWVSAPLIPVAYAVDLAILPFRALSIGIMSATYARKYRKIKKQISKIKAGKKIKTIRFGREWMMHNLFYHTDLRIGQ